MTLQEDGNFVMYIGGDKGFCGWESGSNKYGGKSPYIVVQDDGNVCLYDEQVKGCHWTTNTCMPV